MLIELDSIFEIERRYNSAGRFYHNFKHVKDMLKIAREVGINLTDELTAAILMHDIVYTPGDPKNEFLSVLEIPKFFRRAGHLSTKYL
jgi:predicted metal-dependent HD superfamily phosphohydrolase